MYCSNKQFCILISTLRTFVTVRSLISLIFLDDKMIFKSFTTTSYFLPSSMSLNDAKMPSLFSPIEYSSIATCRSQALLVKSDAVLKRSNLYFPAIHLDGSKETFSEGVASIFFRCLCRCHHTVYIYFCLFKGSFGDF